MEKLIINLSNFTIIDSNFGEGSFARVVIVEDKADKKQYAAKINKTKCTQVVDQRSFFTELSILNGVASPALLRLKGFSLVDFEGNNFPTILTEFMPNGSLAGMLERERNGLASSEWNNTKKQINIIGIAIGLKHLHEHHISHRDVKPANVLLDQNLYPKICDFGISRSVGTDESSSLMATNVGTPVYMAPEIIRGQKYGFAVDVFSFSMVCYEIICGESPILPGSVNVFQYATWVTSGKRPDIRKITNPTQKMLIEKCWQDDPGSRPTFNDIVNLLLSDSNTFLPDVDVEEVENYLTEFDLCLAKEKVEEVDTITTSHYDNNNNQNSLISNQNYYNNFNNFNNNNNNGQYNGYNNVNINVNDSGYSYNANNGYNNFNNNNNNNNNNNGVNGYHFSYNGPAGFGGNFAYNYNYNGYNNNGYNNNNNNNRNGFNNNNNNNNNNNRNGFNNNNNNNNNYRPTEVSNQGRTMINGCTVLTADTSLNDNCISYSIISTKSLNNTNISICSGDIVCLGDITNTNIIMISGILFCFGNMLNVNVGNGSGDIICLGTANNIEYGQGSGSIIVGQNANNVHIKQGSGSIRIGGVGSNVGILSGNGTSRDRMNNSVLPSHTISRVLSTVAPICQAGKAPTDLTSLKDFLKKL